MLNSNPVLPTFRPAIPLVLRGRLVSLEPLEIHHSEELFGISKDAAIWTYMPVRTPRTAEDMAALIAAALDGHARGEQVPFIIRDLTSGTLAGSTRYLDLSPEHRSVEIGWTWVSPSYQRTSMNTEAKYLLLRDAFEEMGAVRVQIKTDLRNERAQRAIERLGAIREGVLRKHRVLSDGYIRDSVYYSIIDTEWSAVKVGLEKRLGY